MIYLDSASTTSVRKEVLAAMQPYFSEEFGNPSSIHALGIQARNAVEESREKIRTILQASPEDKIIFTSGGTESINLAIQGIAHVSQKKGNQIITSTIEHDAVLESCKHLEDENFRISYVPVDHYGIVDFKKIQKEITDKTILISIMYANNEIGTIQPIEEMGKMLRKYNIPFHTDACQAAGLLDLDVKKLNVDLLTLNGSKISGPKGAGILYVKDGIKLRPLFYGGNQEYGLRSGTENVAAIVGFAKALELAQDEKEKERPRLMRLRLLFIKELKKSLPNAVINGHPTETLPHILNITLPGIDAEQLVKYLSQEEIYISAGSACSYNTLKPSHVLAALGKKEKDIFSSVRFSFGKETTEEDVLKTVKVLVDVVKVLREVL